MANNPVEAQAEARGSDEFAAAMLSILELLLGDQLPADPLGPDTVPAKALAIPIGIAQEELITHAKTCNRGPRCRHLPSQLKIKGYGRMRPRALKQDKAVDDVHRALWEDGDHGLVKVIRNLIIEKHEDIVRDVRGGAVLSDDRLPEILNSLGPDGPCVLTGLLWAMEFDAPDAELLFRILIPVINAREVEPDKNDVGGEDLIRKLRSELRGTRKEIKEQAESYERARQTIRLKEQKLAATKEAYEGERDRRRALRAELEAKEVEAAGLGRRLTQAEEQGKKSVRVSANLRRDLKRQSSQLDELQQNRSGLALELSKARRTIERLEFAEASQLGGHDLVWAYLEEEEERIKQDRLILSGADKEHAAQEWTLHKKLKNAFLEGHPEYKQPRPVTLAPKSEVQLLALGGSDEVGMSCYVLEMGSHRIMVDCGIRPSGTEDLHPDLSMLDHLDALVLTHAHTDHIGWTPALVRRFPNIDIYCTEETAALLPVMLEDSRRHYVRKLAGLRDRARYSRDAQPVEEEYDEDDVRMVSQLAIGCDLERVEMLPFGGVTLQFFRAGHILGAASILVRDQTGRAVFFSGDISSRPQLTVFPASWPHDLGELDLLLLESTYGNRNHPPFGDSRQKLVNIIRRTLEERGGSVILASFALGRAQELLRIIANAMEEGTLPGSTPVHIDGMIRSINPIYRRHSDFELPEHFNEVSGQAEREEIATHDAHLTPSIIVTTSGMLAGGPVVEYAQHLLPHEQHRIVLTGYQDEGAPSRALVDMTRSVGGPRKVSVQDESGDAIEFEAALPAAEVSLSAHADQAGLIEYAARLAPRYIALVHGEAKAQKVLRRKLEERHDAEVICSPSRLKLR